MTVDLDRKAKRKVVLASSLGTGVVMLTQYPEPATATALHFYSACVLSFAVPLVAWSFLNVFVQDDLARRQRALALIGLAAFLIGFIGHLLTIGYVPAILFVVAAAITVADHLITPSEQLPPSQ